VRCQYFLNVSYCFILHRERDEFDRELTDLKKQFAYLDATHEMITKERDNLSAEVRFVISIRSKLYNIFMQMQASLHSL